MTAFDAPGPTGVSECWNRVGTHGDRSCPELQTHIHCRNCPVYAAAAASFFDRSAPDGYLAEWTQILSAPIEPPTSDAVSALVFRLAGEWLALPTRTVVEVTTPRVVHHIPHRTNATLIGLINIRGQLHLCVSLHGLLGVDAGSRAESGEAGGRLVVMRRDGQTWAFPADEVGGIERFPRAMITAVPSTLANPASSFSRSVILWEGRSVGLLDDERVFQALKGLGR